MKKIYAGIDPGKSGGIAFLSEDMELTMYKTPLIGNQMDHQKVRELLLQYNPVMVELEDVHSLPGTSAKANFSFGENKGEHRGILVGLQMPYMEVAPKIWQKIAWEGVSLIKNPKGKTDTKSMSLISAKRIFPRESFLASERSIKPHDGIVDAALLAYYVKCKMG